MTSIAGGAVARTTCTVRAHAVVGVLCTVTQVTTTWVLVIYSLIGFTANCFQVRFSQCVELYLTPRTDSLEPSLDDCLADKHPACFSHTVTNRSDLAVPKLTVCTVYVYTVLLPPPSFTTCVLLKDSKIDGKRSQNGTT